MRTTLLSLLCLCWGMASAQTSDFQQVAARYKNVRSATATVTKTIHQNTKTAEATTRGTLTIRKPDVVSIVTNGNTEKLVMQGTTFTMTYGGRELVTDSRKNPQFTTFHTVLTSLIGGATTDVAALKDVTVDKRNQQVVVTITPPAGPFWRRGIFQAFTLVLDAQTSAFKSLKMVERSGRFTTYAFADFQFDK